jgi:hypothetical protein
MGFQTDVHLTVIEAIAVIVIEAKVTRVMAELQVAMEDKPHMEALTTPGHPSQPLPLTKTPKLSTITLSMPNGPLTMLRTRPKTRTSHMVALLPSWPSTRLQVLLQVPVLLTLLLRTRTMVKLMVRHSPLRPVLELLRHRLLRRPLDMEHHRRHHLLLLRLQVTARYVQTSTFILIVATY